jgi:hypothetical protein
MKNSSDRDGGFMNPELEKTFSHATRGHLRALIATIDRGMSQSSVTLESRSNQPMDEIRSSWAKLVELLALGAAPEVRECPACHRFGMRDATRCGYCWTTLSPLPVSASVDTRF